MRTYTVVWATAAGYIAAEISPAPSAAKAVSETRKTVDRADDKATLVFAARGVIDISEQTAKAAAVTHVTVPSPWGE
jgi:hypothetical protein